MDLRVIKLTSAAKNHGNLNISVCGKEFFPHDVFGSSSRNKGIGIPITLKVDGLNELIKTDIPTDKSSGRPRWLFRERKWLKKFIARHNLTTNDSITISRLNERTYSIGLDNSQRQILFCENSFALSKKKLNVIDLFCGCGGLSLGFIQAGYNLILGVDNDPCSLLTYQRNFRDVKVLNIDISKDNAINEIKNAISGKKIDVLIGGPPFV